MKFILFIFTLLCVVQALAKDTDELEFLDEHSTVGAPFLLPFGLNTKGEIDKIGDLNSFMFSPAAEIILSKGSSDYSYPINKNEFRFEDIDPKSNWIGIRKYNYEMGLGLAAVCAKGATLAGFLPYKGSRHYVIQTKRYKTDKIEWPHLPQNLNEIQTWSNGNYGNYQVYGGITAFVGLSVGILSFADGIASFHNQFILEIQKINDKSMLLRISEESSKRKDLRVGPLLVAHGILTHLEGNRLAAEFVLDFANPDHNQLYTEALEGKIHLLQERLSHVDHRVSWIGSEKTFFWGIPWVVGRRLNHGSYDLKEEEEKNKLEIISRRNTGFFEPERNYQRFIYHTKNGMVLSWLSEMAKIDNEFFEDRFFKFGRSLGVKGFNVSVPVGKYGKVTAQLTVQVSLDEISQIKDVDLNRLEKNLSQKCVSDNLVCADDLETKKIVKSFKKIVNGPAEKFNQALGVLLSKQPQLLYSLVKNLKIKKNVYFKFLSERFQSMQGNAPIEI